MQDRDGQEAKDRIRAQHDYQINLKAELEIRNLHQKMDHLLVNQWQRLVEIQELQLELMNEIRDAKKKLYLLLTNNYLHYLALKAKIICNYG